MASTSCARAPAAGVAVGSLYTGVGVEVGGSGWISVGVGDGVGVCVLVGVAVGVCVLVGVGVGVCVCVAVGVCVCVAVGVCVAVAVGVAVGVYVCVAGGVAVGSGVLQAERRRAQSRQRSVKPFAGLTLVLAASARGISALL